MRSTISMLFVAAIISACSPAEKAADTSTVKQAAAMPAPIKLADIAGKWDAVTKNATNDSVLVRSTMTIPTDTGAWVTEMGPSKTTSKQHVVAIAGDSITTKSDTYSSVLRKGVKVWNSGVFRLVNGKLVGTTTAHYSVKTADSVRTFPVEATRAP